VNSMHMRTYQDYLPYRIVLEMYREKDSKGLNRSRMEFFRNVLATLTVILPITIKLESGGADVVESWKPMGITRHEWAPGTPG